MTYEPLRTIIFQQKPRTPATTISETGPQVVNGLGDTGQDVGKVQLDEILMHIPNAEGAPSSDLAHIPTDGEFGGHIEEGLASGAWREVGSVAIRRGIPGEPLIRPRYTTNK